MSEIKDPKGCKWFGGIRKFGGGGGCNLHPLSDNSPSTCCNSEKYPCDNCVKRVKP